MTWHRLWKGRRDDVLPNSASYCCGCSLDRKGRSVVLFWIFVLLILLVALGPAITLGILVHSLFWLFLVFLVLLVPIELERRSRR